MTSSFAKPVAALALALAALTACSSDGPAPSEAAPPLEATAATSTAPATSAAPSTPAPVATTSPASAKPLASEIVLFGNDLGPAKIGDPFDDAVAALTTVLGPPDPEIDTVTCIRGDRQVTWGDFTVTSEDGKLSGWLSSSTSLATPSGIRVGTTVATLRRVYGSKLAITKPPGAESVTEFSAQGSVVAGSLDGDGTSDSDTVDALYTAACGQP